MRLSRAKFSAMPRRISAVSAYLCSISLHCVWSSIGCNPTAEVVPHSELLNLAVAGYWTPTQQQATKCQLVAQASGTEQWDCPFGEQAVAETGELTFLMGDADPRCALDGRLNGLNCAWPVQYQNSAPLPASEVAASLVRVEETLDPGLLTLKYDGGGDVPDAWLTLVEPLTGVTFGGRIVAGHFQPQGGDTCTLFPEDAGDCRLPLLTKDWDPSWTIYAYLTPGILLDTFYDERIGAEGHTLRLSIVCPSPQVEGCNGLDDDCDGEIDDGVLTTWYRDNDGDGYGVEDDSQTSCSQPEGYTAGALDCDDSNVAVNPETEEVCNGIDDNCDLHIDEALLITSYLDSDHDGFGDASQAVSSCSIAEGYVENGEDCDDGDDQVYPFASEIQDGKDQNCNDLIDEQYLAVSSDSNFSLALRSDGIVSSWGWQGAGELGYSTYTPGVPQQIPFLQNVTAIATGLQFGIALTSEGVLWGWGAIESTGEVIESPSLDAIAAIDAGNDFALVLDEGGRVFELGLDEAGNWGTWRSIIVSSQTVTAISAGNAHCLALTAGGSVYAWGSNEYGQLGVGTITSTTSPVNVQGLNTVQSIAAGHDVSFAVLEDGTVWGWGRNDDDLLGSNINSMSVSFPVKIEGLTDIAIVSTVKRAANRHGLALGWNGEIWSWGSNDSGQLGHGTLSTYEAPTRHSSFSNAMYIAAGGDFSLVLDEVGIVWGMGKNREGQLGRGHLQSVVGSSLTTALSAGHGQSFMLHSDGTTWGWGDNTFGQLGDGTFVDRIEPVLVQSEQVLHQISVGREHVLAVANDGSVLAWGNNAFGQIGTGDGDTFPVPTVLDAPIDVVATSAGGWHSLAIDQAGKVWTWGRNDSGQLGNGGSVDQALPEELTYSRWEGVFIVAVAAGETHSLALDFSNTVWAWGNNDYGQLGDATNVSKFVPKQVTGLTGVVQIAAGKNFSLVRLEDGTIWGWGDNQEKQINPASGSAYFNSPTQVPGLSSGQDISANGTRALVLKSYATVWEWGDCLQCQVSKTPVKVPGLTSVTHIAAGASHSLALIPGQGVYSWGDNQLGQLGDGTRDPTKVLLP